MLAAYLQEHVQPGGVGLIVVILCNKTCIVITHTHVY